MKNTLQFVTTKIKTGYTHNLVQTLRPRIEKLQPLQITLITTIIIVTVEGLLDLNL